MQCSGEGSALAPAVIGLTPPGTCSQQRIIWPQYKCTLFTTKNKYAMYFITQRPCCLWILKNNFILWSCELMVIKNFYDLVMIKKSSFVKIMRACDHLPELGKGQKILMAGGHQNAGPGKIFHDFITNENFLLFPFLFPPLLLQENIKLPLIVRVHFDFIKTPQHKKLEVFWCWASD